MQTPLNISVYELSKRGMARILENLLTKAAVISIPGKAKRRDTTAGMNDQLGEPTRLGKAKQCFSLLVYCLLFLWLLYEDCNEEKRENSD